MKVTPNPIIALGQNAVEKLGKSLATQNVAQIRSIRLTPIRERDGTLRMVASAAVRFVVDVVAGETGQTTVGEHAIG